MLVDSDRFTSSHSRPSKSLGRTLPRLFCFVLSITRRSVCLELVDQTTGHIEHLLDRFAKGGLIDLRGRIEAAQLAHELEGGCADLLIGRRWLEIEQRLDAAAHDPAPRRSALGHPYSEFSHAGVVPGTSIHFREDRQKEPIGLACQA